MPMLVKNNHWMMLIADVSSRTVGVTNNMSSHDTITAVVDNFVRYMDVRATMTGELHSWTKREYSITHQQDGSSCGVLALMAAEAIIRDVPLAAGLPGVTFLLGRPVFWPHRDATCPVFMKQAESVMKP